MSHREEGERKEIDHAAERAGWEEIEAREEDERREIALEEEFRDKIKQPKGRDDAAWNAAFDRSQH